MALTREQNEAWRALIMATHVLDSALEAQAQRDGGLPHAYYKVLVFLYESPDRRLPLSELAATQRYSVSRMTHAVVSMEKSGWLRRSTSTADRRVRIVELTPDGINLVRRVSPRQVTEVREPVLAGLSREQVAQLTALSRAVVENLTR
jgi:DNA-binding MarR family transcriptional regulator